MKSPRTLAAALVLGILAACAPMTSTTSPTASASAPSTTDKIAVAMQEVTLAVRASTQLAVAGKITWAQDDQAQAALALIWAALNKANGVAISDPAQAAQLLASALTALATYQSTGAVPK